MPEAAPSGGTFCQIGLFEAPITIEYNLIPMHEIRLVGSFAQVPSSWRRALSLIETGLVKTAPLVSSKRPLTEWESAFGAFFTRQECKMLLTPVPDRLAPSDREALSFSGWLHCFQISGHSGILGVQRG